MKKLLLLVAILAVASLHAEPVKIKFNALADLSAALQQMDGSEKAYENVQSQQGPGTRILRIPYDLKTPVRLAIAKDLTAVKAGLEAFEQKRQRALNDASPGAPEKVQTEPSLLTKFMAGWNAAINEPITLELTLLSDDDLNLEKNKELPGSVIAGLAPIIKPPGK